MATVYSEMALDTPVHVSAIAAIVRDLLAGDRARLQNDRWLCERAQDAGLDRHERAALEALRMRVNQDDPTLCHATSCQWG